MYTLRHIPDWASLIILLALEDADQPYDLIKIDYDAGDLSTPSYRALNPLGLLPVLETPQGPVFETGAILLALSDRHPGLAPAPDSAERMAFLSWLFFLSNTLHPTVMEMIHPHRPGGAEGAKAVAEAALARCRSQLGHLETLAKTKPNWLDPHNPSVALPYLAVMFRWAALLAPDPSFRITPSDTPHLQALLAAYETRPKVAAVAQADGLGPHPFSAPMA